MIKYRESFEVISPESAEYGAVEDLGWIHEEPVKREFKEMVELLANTQPSCFPLHPTERNVWFTLYDENPDYWTGCVEHRSYHPVTERDARYMVKAWLTTNRGAY